MFKLKLCFIAEVTHAEADDKTHEEVSKQVLPILIWEK